MYITGQRTQPENIFFANDDLVKIGDFGLATDMLINTEKVGTELYMAPEMLGDDPYNYKVDIYSLGIIYFELLVEFGTDELRVKTLRRLRMGSFPENFHAVFAKQVHFQNNAV